MLQDYSYPTSARLIGNWEVNKFGKPAEEDCKVSDVVKTMIRAAPQLVLARSQCNYASQ